MTLGNRIRSRREEAWTYAGRACGKNKTHAGIYFES